MTTAGGGARAWLVLSRMSNLPTIWTNALAGAVVAGAALDDGLTIATLAVSCLYIGGMVLNDVCDAGHDRVHRPTRPIPAGHVSVTAAAAVTVALFAGGVCLAGVHPPRLPAIGWAGLLVAAIAYYDVWHKRDPLAPLVMGVCRGLVYCVVAASLTGTVTTTVMVAALPVTLYTAAFTFGARHVAAVRPWVSWCIALMSIVDALVLVAAGAPTLALLAVAAVPVTVRLQRIVPGD